MLFLVHFMLTIYKDPDYIIPMQIDNSKRAKMLWNKLMQGFS